MLDIVKGRAHHQIRTIGEVKCNKETNYSGMCKKDIHPRSKKPWTGNQFNSMKKVTGKAASSEVGVTLEFIKQE